MTTVSIQDLNTSLASLSSSNNLLELTSAYKEVQDNLLSVKGTFLQASNALESTTAFENITGKLQDIATPFNVLSQVKSSFELDFAGLMPDLEPTSASTSNNIKNQLETIKPAIGQVINGMEVLSAGANPLMMIGGTRMVPAFGRITERVAELKDDLVREMSDENKTLFEKITGESTVRERAVLHDTVTAMNPEAVANTVKTIFDKDIDQVQNLLKGLVAGKLQSIVLQNLKGSVFGNLMGAISAIVQQFNVGMGGLSMDGVLNNIVEKLTGGFAAQLQSLASRTLDYNIVQLVYNQIATGNFDSALNIFSSYVDKISDIEDEFRAISTDLSSFLAGTQLTEAQEMMQEETARPFSAEPAPANTASPSDPNVGPVDDGSYWEFDVVKPNMEDLGNLLKTRTAETAGTILYWSKTASDHNLTARELHNIAQRNRKAGIGYHFIIQRDGTLTKGRPLNTEGDHSAYHNGEFIGVLLVGGYRETMKELALSSDAVPTPESFTTMQMTTLDNYLQIFNTLYPGAMIIGDNDQGGDGPGFDVYGYARTLLDHENPVPKTDLSLQSAGAFQGFTDPTSTEEPEEETPNG